jgi:hypothetical protein
METGMLWFDHSDRPLNEKVKLAATHFQKKYGRTPDLVLVNPNMMAADSDSTVMHYGKEIHVRPYRPVLPGHLWVGIDEIPEYVKPMADKNASQVRERSEMQEIKATEVQA